MKLTDFIICDDIRKEMGNKHSLMGVYDDAINFNVPVKESGKWPKVMKISFFIRIKIENDDEKTMLNKFKLNINYNEKIKTIAEGVLGLDIKKNIEGIRLALAFNKFAFENSGLMSVSIELMDNADKIKISESIIPENIIQ